MIQFSSEHRQFILEDLMRMRNTVERTYIIAQLYSTSFSWPLKPIFAYDATLEANGVIIEHCYNRSQCSQVARGQVSHVTIEADKGHSRNSSFTVSSVGRNNRIYIGKKAALQLTKLSFGNGSNNLVIIDDGVDLNQVSISFKGSNNLLYIGAMTTYGSGSIAVGENHKTVVIGPECMFSSRVVVDTTDSHSIYDLSTKQRVNQPRSVIIAPKVWLGRDVRVNKGTFIEAQTVVGQGSLASGSLCANSVYAGFPAKQLKSNVTWSRMRCDSVEEMESSARHQGYLEKKRMLLSQQFDEHFTNSKRSFTDRLSMKLYTLGHSHG